MSQLPHTDQIIKINHSSGSQAKIQFNPEEKKNGSFQFMSLRENGKTRDDWWLIAWISLWTILEIMHEEFFKFLADSFENYLEFPYRENLKWKKCQRFFEVEILMRISFCRHVTLHIMWFRWSTISISISISVTKLPWGNSLFPAQPVYKI